VPPAKEVNFLPTI